MLNNQIQRELESSQIYKAMSSFLDSKGWIGGQKLFFKYGQEEMVHHDKIYQYLFDKNCRAVTPAVEPVQGDYKDIREILEISLSHEIEVTKNWNDIAEAAKKEGDNDTYTLAQWFLTEQIEEENKVRELLFKIGLEIPNWELDKVFEEMSK
jgi:ferritin